MSECNSNMNHLLSLLAYFLTSGQCFLVENLIQDHLLDGFENSISGESSSHGLLGRRPLILTPYLENGKILEGQEAAKVEGILDNLKSYSGYFTVNKASNRNLFFWYFPAEEKPADSPVLLWLQGGPGASSMLGLSTEHGPFQVENDGSIQQRPHRWTKNYHVIYVDSPAGVGFSFPQPTEPVNETEISADLLDAVDQFFQLFPQISHNDFYVSGESYGGQYAPSVAHAIHTNNPTRRVKINMKGVTIGNGKIRDNCFSQSNPKYVDFLVQNGLPPYYDADLIDPYNYLKSGSGLDFDCVDTFFNRNDIQEKIHVGRMNYTALNSNVTSYVSSGDHNFSVVPIVEELLEHYPILYYYGQVDTACPYPPSEFELYGLNWSGFSKFHSAQRQHWRVGDDLAGYIKSGGNLSVALVRNAGHMVPTDQPVWCLDLIKKFFNNELPN